MPFLINNTLQFYSYVRLVMANQIVYTWLELTSFLGTTTSRVLSSVLPGTYIQQRTRSKMKLLPHQDFNPKSEEKFF